MIQKCFKNFVDRILQRKRQIIWGPTFFGRCFFVLSLILFRFLFLLIFLCYFIVLFVCLFYIFLIPSFFVISENRAILDDKECILYSLLLYIFICLYFFSPFFLCFFFLNFVNLYKSLLCLCDLIFFSLGCSSFALTCYNSFY